MSILEIQLFKALKSKLGEKEAEKLVQVVKAKDKTEFDIQKKRLAAKVEIKNVHKSFFLVGLGQFLTNIAALLLIVNFMLK